MCWGCGGRCALCGEPSEFTIVAPGLGAAIFTCAEHKDEAHAYADDYLQKLEAAPWN